MRSWQVIAMTPMLAAVAGCGSGPAPAPPRAETGERTGAYIASARRLLGTPAALASLLAQGLKPGAAPPASADVREIAAELRLQVEDLRDVALADPGLRAQRARLAGAATALLPTMEQVARDLDSGDRARLGRSGNRYLTQLRELPSRVAVTSP